MDFFICFTLIVSKISILLIAKNIDWEQKWIKCTKKLKIWVKKLIKLKKCLKINWIKLNNILKKILLLMKESKILK